MYAAAAAATHPLAVSVTAPHSGGPVPEVVTVEYDEDEVGRCVCGSLGGGGWGDCRTRKERGREGEPGADVVVSCE